MANPLPVHRDLIDLKVRTGTRNALHEPALTPIEVDLCLERGSQLIRELAQHGTNAILPGEMGIGNSSAAALLYSALLGLPLDECVGVGAGHDSAGHARKKAILARVQARHPGITTPREALAVMALMDCAMRSAAEGRTLRFGRD